MTSEVCVEPAGAADTAAVEGMARALLPGVGVPRLTLTRVARDERGTVVGWLEAQRVAGEVHVLGVGVVPERRRRGIATALVRSVSAGAQAVHLEVRASNQGARRFYLGLGFDEVEVCSSYYSDGEDAVLLSLGAV